TDIAQKEGTEERGREHERSQRREQRYQRRDAGGLEQEREDAAAAPSGSGPGAVPDPDELGSLARRNDPAPGGPTGLSQQAQTSLELFDARRRGRALPASREDADGPDDD